ncbi:MAG: hypothetical protein ACP5XB_01390 [Isosphaeraceae bacterium]
MSCSLRTAVLGNLLSPLVVASLIALAAAVILADQPSLATIPDPVLSGIRGSNPECCKQADPNCTNLNVQALDANDPPGAPPTAVAYFNCLWGLNKTTICISCNDTVRNYFPQMMTMNQKPANPSIYIPHDCGSNNGGMVGKCTLNAAGQPICASQKAYTCNVNAGDLPYQ